MLLQSKKEKKNMTMDMGTDTSRDIPAYLSTDVAFAYNQNQLAIERTEFAKIRTDLSLTNSRMSVDRTHLSYMRTIVSLIGSGATLNQALPLVGVNQTFTYILTGFLLLTAVYFIYKDATTYPKMKKQLLKMEEHANQLAKEANEQIYRLSDITTNSENEVESLDD